MARFRNLALRPTLFGARALLFYAVVLGGYFGAPYVNLFFLLLGFLTLQWIAAFVWTWRNVGRVEAVAPRLALERVAGDEGRFTVELNQPRGRAFDVQIELPLVNGTEGRSARGRVDVLSGTRRVGIEVPALPRGVWSTTEARLVSTYPFGLLRRARRVALEAEVVVTPVPTALGAKSGRTAQDLMNELAGDGRSGAGDLQPSSLRDHCEGESLRGVHWKASARRARLVVQEWEGGAGEGLEVVLDRRAEPERLEEALSDLAALVRLAREGKELLALHTQGLDAVFGAGHVPWERAARFLAEAEVVPAGGPAPPSVSPGVLRLPRTSSAAGRTAAAPDPEPPGPLPAGEGSRASA